MGGAPNELADALAERLGGGDRRSIGDADAVAEEALDEPDLVGALWRCLRSDDALVRMRSADALEKVSRKKPALLAPWRKDLLSGALDDGSAEVRWNLLAIAPRLTLSSEEARTLLQTLSAHLYEDRSRIVRTASLEAIAILCVGHPDLRIEAHRLLTASLDDPTPSLRARARRMLARADVRRALATLS